MGREHIRTGKHIFPGIACLIISLFWGCATLKNIENQSSAGSMLLQSREFISEGNFNGALKENEKVMSLFIKEPPGDQAVYNMGLIYAHYKNPGKDFNKSLIYFKKLLEEYPKSPLAEQAVIWSGLIKKYIMLEEKTEITSSAEEYLLRGSTMLSKGDFQDSIKEYKKVLSLYNTSSPSDQALFNLGLIYAHYGNPDKDYKESGRYFERLIQKHPESPLAEQAKIWLNVLNIIEKAKQVDIEIDKKKREMTR